MLQFHVPSVQWLKVWWRWCWRRLQLFCLQQTIETHCAKIERHVGGESKAEEQYS